MVATLGQNPSVSHDPRRPDRGDGASIPPRAAATRKRSLVDPEFADQLSSPVEYLWSPEFEQPELVDEILDDCTVASQSTGVPAPPNTPPYLAALYGIPLLQPDEEFRIFRQMNFWKHRAEVLRRQMLSAGVTPARRRRFQDHLAAAAKLRNRIVEANLRLVVSIAKTLVDDANPLEDLISDGNVPLLRAVEIFDFTRGLRFSTYATWAIRNCLFRSTPRNRRVVQRFQTGIETAFLALSAADSGLPESVGDEPRASEQIARLLDELPERDRQVVQARFGLGGRAGGAKFREIAAELNLSTERVRQLLGRALDRLRESVTTTAPDLMLPH